MEIVLFILLVGVWAAFVLPSFLNRRRDKVVNRQPGTGDSMLITPDDLHRRQVLARRRLALVILMVAAIATLIGAVLTGSYLLLALTLIMDVMLAVYVAVLLSIKQHQAAARYGGAL
jgi:small-conductance mechanosensitive channel